jgi:hypothetical protein
LQPSNTELTELRWMTLVEALGHIQSTKQCCSVSAQVQLKNEIRRCLVPVKWADSKGPKDVPNVRVVARSQLVLSGPGLAPSGVSLRPLLVLRAAVLSIWRRPGGETIAAPNGVQAPMRGLTEDEWEQQEEEENYDQWMNLVEAIEHIRMLYDCESVEALWELKGEIGDGMVGVRWTDSTGPDDNPDGKRLAASQLLLIGMGIAPDEDGGEGTYRPLLVERFAVQKLWPLAPNKPKSDSVSDLAESKKSRASDEEIRIALREVYREVKEAGNKPPNINEAWDRLRLKLRNTRREQVRKILHEPAFASLRRDAGKQS